MCVDSGSLHFSGSAVTAPKIRRSRPPQGRPIAGEQGGCVHLALGAARLSENKAAAAAKDAAPAPLAAPAPSPSPAGQRISGWQATGSVRAPMRVGKLASAMPSSSRSTT